MSIIYIADPTCGASFDTDTLDTLSTHGSVSTWLEGDITWPLTEKATWSSHRLHLTLLPLVRVSSRHRDLRGCGLTPSGGCGLLWRNCTLCRLGVCFLKEQSSWYTTNYHQPEYVWKQMDVWVDSLYNYLSWGEDSLI